MAQYSIPDLINEYARQRKQGQSAVQALGNVFKMQSGLSQQQQQELSQKIRQWEREWQSGAASPSPISTHTVAAIPSTAEDANSITCPRCQSLNAAGSTYCISCGEVFEQAISFETRQLASENTDKTFFSKDYTLLLWIRGHTQKPLRVKFPEEKPLLIGRGDPRSLRQPDVDLKDYEAEKMGVSRQHAFLQRSENTLTLVDKGSSNHSYINGERVRNNEVRVLGDGDTLRLGNLSMRLTFQAPSSSTATS